MDHMMDKRFLRAEDSDFVVIVGDQRLNVHKSVLMSSSEYFSALFNSEMIETKTKEISLKETLIKPFVIVLRMSYGFAMTDEEWLELKIQELFESIVTANKYQFIECERQLSYKLIDIFAYEVRTRRTDHSMLTIWELLEMAKLHNLMFLSDNCLKYFDENTDIAFETFDNQFISADILLDVINRDTFGAPEIDIFKLVEKWIQKHRIRSNRKCIEETLLLDSVRLPLLSLEQLSSEVLKSGLYEQEMIERIAKHELNGDLAQNQRICNQSGKVVTSYCSSELHIKNEHYVVIFVNCLLPMPSKINHMMFTIRHNRCYDQLIDPLGKRVYASYWIGIADSRAENGFRRVLDYMEYSCIGEQELYFEEPFVTNSIRIAFECNTNGLLPGRPEQEDLLLNQAPPHQVMAYHRSLMSTVRHDRKFLDISSIKYEFTKSPLKILNSCIVPEVNVCTRLGADCCSPYFSHEFSAVLNEHVLNNPIPEDNAKYEWRYLMSEKLSKAFNAMESFIQLIQTPSAPVDDNHYIIRLTQPIFVDCLQFELILENEKRRHSDECLAAECEVQLSPAFNRDLNFNGNWITVGSGSYLTESGSYNLEFELQKVSAIKISGFRYNSDKSLVYVLHIKNFCIPADRQSLDWVSGFKLGIEAPIADG